MERMFNPEQVEHMRELAALPPEAKCRCGWWLKGDCVNCNLRSFEVAGGRIHNGWSESRYYAPDGSLLGDYGRMVTWLRARSA